ncbi:unnamed protein product [Rotaria sordida]|uniref:Uncharacterized protein n=1 Tax=Rotaria sordida TaxID=392033 RepID=A0A819P3P2_9BILA|nr:unnamed protein product [Rotaria sordida]
MQYKQGSEVVSMINASHTSVQRPFSLNEDPEIKRTRKILLTILSVFLALSVIGTISAIYENGISNSTQGTQGGVRIGQSLISVLFYGFGIFVAYGYFETGLKVKKILIDFIFINNESNIFS